MIHTYRKLTAYGDHPVVRDLLFLFTRIALGAIFWQSGRTKVEDGSFLELSDTTFFLFEEEYSGVPLPPELAAHMATYSEHLFPILLLLGLGSRFAAAALVGMTLVIQLFVYPDAWWVPHMGWVALGLVILTLGPGRISLDHLISKRFAA